MMRIGLRIIVAMPFVAGLAAAQAPDPYEVKVQALAHARYAERERAARDLLSAGEPALKALRAATKSADPELRTRAAAIVERIERRLLSERLIVAPRIAIKLENVPLQQAVTELATKTGLRFVLEPGKSASAQRLVSVDTGEVPFWKAIDAFCSAAGLIENDGPPSETPGRQDLRTTRIYLERSGVRAGNNSAIRLTDGKPSASAATEKAIRVRALPPSFAQNKFDAATGEVTFHLDVDAAPALEVQDILGVEISRAVAENRQALAPTYPAPSFPTGYTGMEQLLIVKQGVVLRSGELMLGDGTEAASGIPVTLKTDGPKPQRLSRLDGIMVAQVMAPPEPLVTISDVFGKAPKTVQTSTAVTLTIVSARENGPAGNPAIRLRLSSHYEAVNELLNFPVRVKGRVRPFIQINRRSGESPASASEFQLRDADGRAIRLQSTRVISSNFDGTNITQEVELQLEKPAAGRNGVNLTLAGRRPATIEMPFTLTDVPLP